MGCCEGTTRNWEYAGEIKPVAQVDGRSLFLIADVLALKEKRDALRRKAA
jgi:hypothetical protein